MQLYIESRANNDTQELGYIIRIREKGATERQDKHSKSLVLRWKEVILEAREEVFLKLVAKKKEKKACSVTYGIVKVVK